MLKKLTKLMLMIPLVFVFTGQQYVSAESNEVKAEVFYDCQIAIPIFPDMEFVMPTTIQSTVPTEVAPGEEFILENSSASVAIPEETISTLYGLLGWDEISGEVDLFEVHAENEDDTQNVADPPLGIPVTPVPDSGDLEFTVPEGEGVEAGPFTAGEEGEVVFSAGDINATIEEAGGSIISISAECEPQEDQDLTLTSIPIVAD
ncbi:DUF6801 domain-containing protein [Salicibibacter kimchii]|uniref:DUF6801 domain-containing protein n=1 Tax=Salicibibacter kimchii TaxID=2099786 RepID=A0A345C0Z9_9BACI|nr:DUF6801 domain-containing protein [Salicibibacter kimchii]AXF56880.1 hypothetical protein DT065_13295 [Salicibibacter kimchii]